ncbi:hypothetical protein [Massilia yuzhufengensis]|uniref:Uncharacterized protein n=1 Tax=Massilia yuzhufengensis TaxID=1164594 RepID=A0A1I1M3H5_9BURK|nr:hypothetical protein [Massilia yuzhufengensis]SFC79785.1 hypothetical protein SAMN05216204_11098 [Massilia yuzhufengensis]
MLALAQLPEMAPYAVDPRTTMAASTPLFFYVLKEAEVLEDGLRLGPVGSRIVAEVFVGPLKLQVNAVRPVKSTINQLDCDCTDEAVSKCQT